MDMLYANEYKDMKIFVSITSIYNKQHALLETLQSIKSQTHRFDKCYIYLSEEEYLLDKGFKHRALIDKNLDNFLSYNSTLFSVRWVANIGPYRKLIPIVKEKQYEDCLIIAIDDDTVYHKDMIKIYLDNYSKHNCCIASRCYSMLFDDIKQVEYDCSKDKIIDKDKYNFHTGKGGVLYHPKFFAKTMKYFLNDNIFNKISPTADDVWFNFHRIANNVDCKVIHEEISVKDITQEFSLYMNINHHVDKTTKENYNTKAMRCVANKLIELGYTL